MIIEEENYLAHYGIIRKSGRYPWGTSGWGQGGSDTPAQRSKSLMDYVQGLMNDGMSEADVARGLGMTTTELRAARAIARNQAKQADIIFAQRLKDKGYSNVAIGERMGLNESSVRALLKPGEQDKLDVLTTTSNMLRDQVNEKGYLDIGAGVEHYAGVSRTKLDTAVAMLKEEGYSVHTVQVEQLGTGHQTTVKVLAPPDATQRDVWMNRQNIKSLQEFSEDGGRSFLGMSDPLSIDAKRVDIRYAEDGGADADGVIYVRPGVEDVSLGGASYAQVRVSVGGSHYLKGMAIYKDDLPDGVDIQFNTNKKNTGDKFDAMKALKDDPDNPFGATVRQIIKKNPDGTETVKSSMNIVNEEGDWDSWGKNLSSQMLSKQSPVLAKEQLDFTYQAKAAQLDEIRSLTNPTVRKRLLEAFADEADSSAVHLKAAAMPRQATKVILPVNAMKETEVYAPTFRNGERVALVRYPHGGTFEIPELTVNNRNPKAKSLLGNAPDAIGINSKVAERLSGADFDGDTVLVIPNSKGRVKSTPALEGLKNFDPVAAYPGYEGMKPMSARAKQQQMGDVSNLITDMTIRGANPTELAKAVRHSMVVIDAEKHKLNYKQSYEDNSIAHLKEKYQGRGDTGRLSGASTLISRATSDQRVPERKPRPAGQGGGVDPETGKKVYVETGRTRTTRDGKVTPRQTRTTKLAETDDAHTLSSGTPIESVYANHSNKLKAMANQARKEALRTEPSKYSPSAKEVYKKEVESLNAKLNIAERNAPRERQATLLANTVLSAKKQANPNMEAAEIKKVKSQALNEARNRTGAKKTRITPTQQEWDAIQAGAVSNHRLSKILDHSDMDAVKQLATPKRSSSGLTAGQKSRAQAMLNVGYTQAEVADQLGISVTTLSNEMKED